MDVIGKFRGLQRRTRNFVAEARLGPIARSVSKEGLTYLSAVKMSRLESTLTDVLKLGVAGDLLEFGVALGGSAIVIAAQGVRSERKFHGFDVFGMIPPPDSDKDDDKSKARYAVITSGKSEGIKGATYYGYRPNLYNEVSSAFKRYEIPVDEKRVFLHTGLFNDTIPKVDLRHIAFAHIDCDWYDPVKLCLESIADGVEVNGAIILDDYNDYGGCKVATDEFLRNRSDYVFQNGENAILRKRPVT